MAAWPSRKDHGCIFCGPCNPTWALLLDDSGCVTDGEPVCYRCFIDPERECGSSKLHLVGKRLRTLGDYGPDGRISNEQLRGLLQSADLATLPQEECYHCFRRYLRDEAFLEQFRQLNDETRQQQQKPRGPVEK